MSDKLKSIHDVGEKLGVSRAAMDSIVQEIMANKQKLNSCKLPHDFSICLARHSKQPIRNPSPTDMLGAKWKCTKCGGYVEPTAKTWYNQGLLDAAKA